MLSSVQGMSAIWDVRYWEVSLYHRNFKTSWNYCLVLSPPPKIKILSVLAKNS